MRTFIIKDRSQSIKLISILFLVTLWQIMALVVGSELKLPSPKATFISMMSILSSATFFGALFSTLVRGSISLVISLITAVIFGFLAGMIKPINEFLKPYITIIRSTPTISVIFILLTTFGTGSIASIAICILVAFPIIYSNVVKGIEAVDGSLVQMAKLYQVPQMAILKDVYIPSIKNYIYAGLNATIGLTFKVMISAEVLGEVKGSVGKQLYLANVTLNKPEVFAWSILLILMVWFIDFIWDKSVNKKWNHKRS